MEGLLDFCISRGEKCAIEVKRGPNPKPERGFHEACHDLNPARRLVVYPVSEKHLLAKDIGAVPLSVLCAELGAAGRSPVIRNPA